MIDIRNPKTVGMQLGYTRCQVNVVALIKKLRTPIEKEIDDLNYYSMSNPKDLALAKAKQDLLKTLELKILGLKNEDV